jgi:hypothetical protein
VIARAGRPARTYGSSEWTANCWTYELDGVVAVPVAALGGPIVTVRMTTVPLGPST